MAIRISTKGRYGLRALVDLALNNTGRPVLLGDIARRQGISRRYLERLFTQLRSRGIVRSVRGAAGGYLLARAPQDVRVLEVIESLEGPIELVECAKRRPGCRRRSQCVAADLWSELSELLSARLANITLDDLRRKQTELSDAGAPMFYI
jgi:Rrf2 family protein